MPKKLLSSNDHDLDFAHGRRRKTIKTQCVTPSSMNISYFLILVASFWFQIFFSTFIYSKLWWRVRWKDWRIISCGIFFRKNSLQYFRFMIILFALTFLSELPNRAEGQHLVMSSIARWYLQLEFSDSVAFQSPWRRQFTQIKTCGSSYSGNYLPQTWADCFSLKSYSSTNGE